MGETAGPPKPKAFGSYRTSLSTTNPKDWRRTQSSYLQSLQPPGADRLTNDQVGNEKNKTTTKRPIRKFLQNYCSAWERLTCEPAFDIKGFL